MMDSVTGESAVSLLGSDEPSPVELVNADGRSSAVLVCDHASNRVPRQLGTLGLDAVQLADHIGWDPGAADVARRLSIRLDAPLLLSGYLRLVIDCNRPLRSTGSIAEQSDGVPVPGNRRLSPLERESRINALYRPYHEAIGRLLDGRARRPGLLLSMHSFMPVLNGRPRPWHVGVSHWRDRRLAALMLGALARRGDLTTGGCPFDIRRRSVRQFPQPDSSRRTTRPDLGTPRGGFAG
jgi:predicted N-formylglutamate amidohydrolase